MDLAVPVDLEERVCAQPLLLKERYYLSGGVETDQRGQHIRFLQSPSCTAFNKQPMSSASVMDSAAPRLNASMDTPVIPPPSE